MSTVRYLPTEWALPHITEQNSPFFTAGKLVLQQCASCSTIQHPPEEVCHRCQNAEFTSVESVGTGVVYSYVDVRYATSPALKDAIPYNVVLVAPDDYPDIRIIGNITNLAPDDITIGQKVRVTFARIEPSSPDDEVVMLPQWEAI